MEGAMTKRTTNVTTFSPELANEVRAACVRLDSVRTNPAAYSAAETEQIHMSYYRAVARVLAETGITPDQDYEFHAMTGVIWINEEY